LICSKEKYRRIEEKMGNNMFDMIKQASQMKAQVMKIEKELAAMKIEGESSKGEVKITALVNGKLDVIGLSITESEETKKLDIKDLTKLVLGAITKAQSEAKNEAAKIARNLQLG